MEDRDDVKAIAAQPIGNHVWRAWHHEFPRARNAAWPAEIGTLGQGLNRIQKRRGDPPRRRCMVARDGGTKLRQVTDRAPRPDDDHTRGAFRSRFRPQERSHAETFL